MDFFEIVTENYISYKLKLGNIIISQLIVILWIDFTQGQVNISSQINATIILVYL